MAKKVSIAIVMPDMELGGVEKSLVSLLQALGEQKDFLITLLLFRKSGVLLKRIPSWVNVKEIKGGKLDFIRKKTADFLAKRGTNFFFDTCKSLYHSLGSRLSFSEKKNKYQYDIAIAYKDGAATWFTANNIIAKKKIAFIHTDFSHTNYSATQESKIYKNFNRIYCPSLTAKESFLRLLPEFFDRTFVFYNIIDGSQIRRYAMEGPTFPDEFKGKRILTIGRLSREKGLNKAIQVLLRLKLEGYPVRWYVIGKGRDEQKLKNLAIKYGLEKDFIFLGELENPYRMLSDCDIYVQPSNYEGYCIALAEARILCRPVVACNFAGAREQIQQNVTGIITGMVSDEIYEGVKSLLTNENFRRQIIQNLKNIRNNSIEVQINEIRNYLKWAGNE